MNELQRYFVYNRNLEEDSRHLTICFYHAGGSAISYKKWVDFEPDVVFAPIELPGRGVRAKEACICDFTELVEQLVPIVKEAVARRSYSIFGHSLGSALAFKVEHLLEKRYNLQARKLIVAGRHGPNIEDPSSFRIEMGEKALVEEIKSLNEETAHIYDNQDFLDYFLPIIHNDYKLHEDFRYEDELVQADICAHAGSEDTFSGYKYMKEWEKVTQGSFTIREFTGNHFFVHNLGEDYIREVVRELISR